MISIMGTIVGIVFIIVIGGSVALLYLLAYALLALDILIKVSAVALPIFALLHILVYHILKKNGIFAINDGWKKYAVLALRIYLIAVAVIQLILFVTALGFIFVFPIETLHLPE